MAAVLWHQGRKSGNGAIYKTRNFYGVLTVYEYDKTEPKSRYSLLLHGRITHGLQFADPEKARWPTSYYGADSGIARAVLALPPEPRRIGVVGLGTGTLSAYGRAGDYLRIYEINPQVRQIATNRFSYLHDCPGQIEVVLGDARLSMEREPPQHFDLLALDAFSSDSIPVHLLTKEAFDIYERHLATNGIIAVHVSNHYLDLEPVVMNLARRFNYKAAIIDYDEADEWWLYASTWILLSRSEQIIDSPGISELASAPETNSIKIPLWTDDFASLFQILK
jgi:spermidine synthase